jgi:hypothetical protein
MSSRWVPRRRKSVKAFCKMPSPSAVSDLQNAFTLFLLRGTHLELMGYEAADAFRDSFNISGLKTAALVAGDLVDVVERAAGARTARLESLAEASKKLCGSEVFVSTSADSLIPRSVTAFCRMPSRSFSSGAPISNSWVMVDVVERAAGARTARLESLAEASKKLCGSEVFVRVGAPIESAKFLRAASTAASKSALVTPRAPSPPASSSEDRSSCCWRSG